MYQISTIELTHSSLRSYIDQVIFIEPSDDDTAVEFIQLPLVREYLLINFGNPIHYTQAPNNDRRQLRTEGAYLLGKTKQQRRFHVTLNHPVALVLFKPCTLYLFSDQSAAHYVDRIVTLPCDIVQQSPAHFAQSINDYLVSRFVPRNFEEMVRNKVFDIVQFVQQHYASISVAKVGLRFGLSEATLYRYFKKYIGINLATYIKHLKFGAMLQRLYYNDYSAASAIECGFFDQSHFIKEFKRLYSAPPSAFMKLLEQMFQSNAASRDLFERCYIQSSR
ncbi:MAG: helix-turn-helix transcriptional regulator [Campylobacterales bacterium]|nr:helix-turn-helix transcriptional regulator [Campylobacterales bacterium]